MKRYFFQEYKGIQVKMFSKPESHIKDQQLFHFNPEIYPIKERCYMLYIGKYEKKLYVNLL